MFTKSVLVLNPKPNWILMFFYTSTRLSTSGSRQSRTMTEFNSKNKNVFISLLLRVQVSHITSSKRIKCFDHNNTAAADTMWIVSSQNTHTQESRFPFYLSPASEYFKFLRKELKKRLIRFHSLPKWYYTSSAYNSSVDTDTRTHAHTHIHRPTDRNSH